jgi:hypothetical protein
MKSNPRKKYGLAAEYLSVISPYAEKYLPPEGITSFGTKISRIISSACRHYIFEFSIDRDLSAADVSLCILSSESSILAENMKKESIKNRLLKNRTWYKIFQFCQSWAASGSILNQKILSIWLEFDQIQFQSRLPEPCLFVTPVGIHGISPDNPHNKTECIHFGWLFSTAAGSLLEDFDSPKIRENLIECVRSLPPKGIIFQIGIMFPRKIQSVRLCASMPSDEIPAYLENIGWRGPLDDLKRIIFRLKNYVDWFFVDFDVGQDIESQIGIECVFKDKKLDQAKISKLLDYLVDINLCSILQREKILSWFGHSYENVDSLERAVLLLRTLSHLKITINPDNSVNAKAYLLFSDAS